MICRAADSYRRHSAFYSPVLWRGGGGERLWKIAFRGLTGLCIAFKKVFPTPFLAIKTTCKPSKPHKLREKEMKSVNFSGQTFIIWKLSDNLELWPHILQRKRPLSQELLDTWSFSLTGQLNWPLEIRLASAKCHLHEFQPKVPSADIAVVD